MDFEPLEGQKSVIKDLAHFVSASSSENEVFLLKGYAGTGKTTTIAALVKALNQLKISSVLLAPTGRAAKVLNNYSGKEAYTIHKKIYRQQSSKDGFENFNLDYNSHNNTLFIVDEASMISNNTTENTFFGSGRLLNDLFEFVYNKKFCKLILIGDTAQLPPVKLDISPALDINELETFGYEIIEHELTEVVRQAQNSGILFNATKLRKILKKTYIENTTVEFKGYPKIITQGFNDIIKINGSDLIDTLSAVYDKYSDKDVAVICRSNKQANRYNQGIRAQVFYREDEIISGDLIMVVKNNYFWTENIETIDFIANGDIAEIIKVKKISELYGYRFADVRLKFRDYNNTELDVKIILDTLHSETASLSYNQNKELFLKIEEDYSEIKNKKNRLKKIRENPYFNALQVKFAYAITCHKAQGGQWKNIFIDQGWINQEMINKEYLRWLYTAFTRSTEKLYLINFKNEFFPENEQNH
jgi:exodeoxyribonuclease-5